MLDRKLEHLQPSFREKVRRLSNDCRYEHIALFLNEGWRPKERQDELYAQGRTTPGQIVTRARWFQSYHTFGLAVDLYPCDKSGNAIWDFNPSSDEWRRVVKLAKLRGLAWGGDWRHFKDYPHFQDAQSPPLWLCRLRWPKGWRPS